MIGYVLLITFGIILSTIVYSYLKSYVPKDLTKCPDETSISIQSYDCSGQNLTFTLKNNGRFNLAGFFILATSSPEQELATVDLSKNVVEDIGNQIFGNSILLSVEETGKNSFKPGEEETVVFLLNGNQTHMIQITPVRFEEKEGKTRFASCGNARVKEQIICPVIAE